MEAAVAGEEPHSAANIVHASVVLSTRPPLKRRRYFSASGCYNLEDFIRNAINFQCNVKPGNFIKFKNCVSNFLVSAFQELTLPQSQPVKYSATDESMMLNMRRIIIYMRDHFSEGLTLQDLAAALNYSPRHCQRLIQEYLGVGFSDYILAHQIRHAKRLLRASSATLEEIAEQSGFSSAKTLTQRFKALTGMRHPSNTARSTPGITAMTFDAA